MMKREGIEVARAGQMTGMEILGRPRIDEDHAGVAKVLLEPSPSTVNFSESIALTYRFIPTASPMERKPLRRSKSDRPELIFSTTAGPS